MTTRNHENGMAVLGFVLISSALFGLVKLYGAASSWWGADEEYDNAELLLDGNGVAVEDSYPEASSQGRLAIGEDERSFVCRATIASIMGRDISTISATSSDGEQFITQYVRPSDNTMWSQICKIEGRDVVWASYENGMRGRWRDNPLDERITYDLREDAVRIEQVFGDGSSISDSYERE